MRKSGKTSLLLEFLRRISREVLGIRVDCWRVRSDASELFAQLGSALLDRFVTSGGLAGVVPLPGSARTEAGLAECIGAARGRVPPVVLEGMEMLRELARGEHTVALYEGLADLPERLATETGEPTVVAIDEFQELDRLVRPRRGGLGGADIYALLRSRWQEHRRVMYVVAGSRTTALRALLMDRDAPFFHHFTPLDVGVFSLPDARLLLETRLVGSGLSAPDRVVEGLIDAVGTLPFYLQVVGATLVDLTVRGTPLDQAAVRLAVDRCLFRPDGVLNMLFRNQFDRVVGRSGMLARTLLALVEPAGLGELAARLAIPSGAAGTYVRRLNNEDMVLKGDGGAYRVADPCMALWLRGQDDLGGVSPPSIIGDASERRVSDELSALGFRLVYQSRGSRGAFDLLALHQGHEVAIQVKTGDPPCSIPAAQVRRMQHEAEAMGWVPLVALAGSTLTFFHLAGVTPGRKRSVRLGRDLAPVEDVLGLLL